MRIRFLKIAFLLIFLSILFLLNLPNRTVQAATVDLVITEIMYNPEGADTGGKVSEGTFYSHEWVEIYNNSSQAIDLTDWRFNDGANHILNPPPEKGGQGSIAIQPGEYAILANDAVTFLTDYLGFSGTVIDIVMGLNNTSDTLSLINPGGNIIDAVTYENSWGGDGDGKSLEKINIIGDNQAGNWGKSQVTKGTPGAENSISGQQPQQEPVCQPTAEICDGIDNDCDDLIDEDLGETTCGIGACKVNVTNCIDGVAQTCTPGLQTEEICDSIDNDCDSEIDEGGACQTPEPTTEPDPISYPSGIFINEFLPSPEGPDVEEEWIEFYNSNTMLINLSGWSIEDTHGKTKSYTFPVGATISSHGFLILDRPTSKIVLNNDGEGLVLKNPLGNSSSSVAYEGKAPLGQSYAREINNTWKWILAPSPGEENSFTLPEETVPEAEPEAQPEPKTETIEEPRPESELEEPELEPSFAEAVEVKPQPKLITYPSGVVINEILPSPTGPDEEEEWIEVFNQNNFEVDLSEWQIQDIKGRVKTYNFSQGTKIGPRGFLVFSRPTTKITLNNDGDGANLIQPNNNIIDQVSYGKAPTGSSYNRTGSGWAWSDTLTPGSKNIIPTQASEKDEEETGSLSEISERELAAIGKQFPKSSRSLFVLLIASVVAIFSGVIVFVLKSKIKLN